MAIASVDLVVNKICIYILKVVCYLSHSVGLIIFWWDCVYPTVPERVIERPLGYSVTSNVGFCCNIAVCTLYLGEFLQLDVLTTITSYTHEAMLGRA